MPLFIASLFGLYMYYEPVLEKLPEDNYIIWYGRANNRKFFILNVK